MLNSPDNINSHSRGVIQQADNLRRVEEAFENYFFSKLAPNSDSEIRREKIYSQIKFLIEKALGKLMFINSECGIIGGKEQVIVLRYGSDPLKTYLPDSDIDVTVIRRDYLLGQQQPGVTSLAQLKLIKKTLELFGESEKGKGMIKSLILIDQADVEIIKLNFEGIFVDISIKQIGGICTLDFMNYMARQIGKEQLLKKSVILIKAWFTYESGFLGSFAACMATYALYVLVLFIFNNYNDELKTPLDVLRKFFKVWGEFSWDNNIITIYSPIKQSNFYERLRDQCCFDMDKLAMIERSSNLEYRDRSLIVTPEKLNKILIKYSSVRLSDQSYINQASKKSLNLKFINIVDPTFTKNNLGKSISKLNSSRIQQGLKIAQRKLNALYQKSIMLEQSTSTGGGDCLFQGLLEMFKYTFESTGNHPVISFMLPQVRKKSIESNHHHHHPDQENININNQHYNNNYGSAFRTTQQNSNSFSKIINEIDQHPMITQNLVRQQLTFDQYFCTPSDKKSPQIQSHYYQNIIGDSVQKNLQNQMAHIEEKKIDEEAKNSTPQKKMQSQSLKGEDISNKVNESSGEKADDQFSSLSQIELEKLSNFTQENLSVISSNHKSPSKMNQLKETFKVNEQVSKFMKVKYQEANDEKISFTYRQKVHIEDAITKLSQSQLNEQDQLQHYDSNILQSSEYILKEEKGDQITIKQLINDLAKLCTVSEQTIYQAK